MDIEYGVGAYEELVANLYGWAHGTGDASCGIWKPREWREEVYRDDFCAGSNPYKVGVVFIYWKRTIDIEPLDGVEILVGDYYPLVAWAKNIVVVVGAVDAQKIFYEIVRDAGLDICQAVVLVYEYAFLLIDNQKSSVQFVHSYDGSFGGGEFFEVGHLAVVKLLDAGVGWINVNLAAGLVHTYPFVFKCWGNYADGVVFEDV